MIATCTLCGVLIDGGAVPVLEQARRDALEFARLAERTAAHCEHYHREELSRRLLAPATILTHLLVSAITVSSDHRLAVQRGLVREALQSLLTAEAGGSPAAEGAVCNPSPSFSPKT